LHQSPSSDLAVPTAAEVTQVISYEIQRYYPEMLEWVAQRTAELVHDEAIEPREIVLLSPYLSDALRYSLSEKLSRKGIPVYSHRPSRSLREEPVVQALLTLAKLAHPHWRLHPGSYDIAYMLVQAIEGLDLVRAQLLSRICVRKQEGRPVLSSFTDIKPDVQERIGFAAGQHYETLRLWLQEQQSAAEEALDFFLSRLFGEVLSQPGFGFHSNMAAGETTANLIESVQKFRWIAAEGTFADESNLSREYLLMLQEGVIAAQYVRSWQFEEENAVLLAPAYTFLMRNRPVNYQFWLDVGSTAWHERLFQPLTHPVVFGQDWPQNRRWTDADEVAYTRAALYRLVLGLMHRCRNTIFLGLSDLNESGFETQGQLMWAFQRVLQKVADR